MPSKLAAELLSENAPRSDDGWALVDKADAAIFVMAIIGLPALFINQAFSAPEVTVAKAVERAVECRTLAATKKVIFEECDGVKIGRLR